MNSSYKVKERPNEYEIRRLSQSNFNRRNHIYSCFPNSKYFLGSGFHNDSYNYRNAGYRALTLTFNSCGGAAYAGTNNDDNIDNNHNSIFSRRSTRAFSSESITFACISGGNHAVTFAGNNDHDNSVSGCDYAFTVDNNDYNYDNSADSSDAFTVDNNDYNYDNSADSSDAFTVDNNDYNYDDSAGSSDAVTVNNYDYDNSAYGSADALTAAT